MFFHRLLFKTPANARKAVIGIIGGGGKTSLMHRLGSELALMHHPVILSSLTKDGYSEDHPVHFFSALEDEAFRTAVFRKENPVFIMDSIENDYKLIGLSQNQMETLTPDAEVMIFECDGARKRPIKAHQPYDPVVPEFATHAIVVVGADAVGARIESQFVHRPELFREIWDVKATYEMEPEFIAKVLTSHYGYLQKLPADIGLSYFVNKADLYPQEATQLAKAISRVSNAAVFYGSLENELLEQIH